MPKIFWVKIPDKIPNHSYIEARRSTSNFVSIVEKDWCYSIKWVFNEIPSRWKYMEIWAYTNLITLKVVEVLWKLPSVSWEVSFVIYRTETWEIIARTKKDFLNVFELEAKK